MKAVKLFILIPILLLSCASGPDALEIREDSLPEPVSATEDSSPNGENAVREPSVEVDSQRPLSELVEEPSEEPAVEPAGELVGETAESVSGAISDNDPTEDVAPVVPEPPPAPPEPISRPELLQAALGLIPDELRYIDDAGSPVNIPHDLDKNGYEDLFILAVSPSGSFAETEGTSISFDILSDTGRLFYEQKEYIAFSLLIFYQFPGEVMLRYSIPLSRELVFTGMRMQEIREGSDFPFCTAISFKTRGGTSEEWVILNGRGITRYTLEETLSVIPVVEDIDGDGYVDIVLHEQAVEEGIGYETFLTWHRWNGTIFKEVKSTNIVRNLRDFFSLMVRNLMNEDRDVFLKSILLPETAAAYRTAGMSDQEIFRELFVPVDQPDIDLYDLEISDVVYPVMRETPFTYQKRSGFEFPLTLGILIDEGGYYFRARLVMNRNPFEENQFGFLPVE